MDGVLNLSKPAGPTSHDVVDEVRRLFGQKKVGHAGTLDPMATGVLIVCLGKATRLAEYLVGARKSYRAKLILGATTTTQDAAGEMESESDASFVTREMLARTAATFVGRIKQVPPMVSAVKHGGKRLYALARQGLSVERKPRLVDVYSIELLSFEPGSRAEAEMLVSCGSGAYIRTICADIGSALGCGAYMAALERTAVGRFKAEDSVTLDDLAQAKRENRLDDCVVGLSEALDDLPTVTLGRREMDRVAHGLPVAAECIELGPAIRLLDESGELIAVGATTEHDGRILVQPRKVLIGSPD